MTFTEIRRTLEQARESTLCNYVEDDPASYLVHLSLEDVEATIACLAKLAWVTRVIADLRDMEGLA